VLKTVIKDDDIGAAAQDLEPSPQAVAVNRDRYTRQSRRQLQRFVSDLLRRETGIGPDDNHGFRVLSPITAGEHTRSAAVTHQLSYQADHGWCLPGTAEGKVPDANHGYAQRSRAQYADSEGQTAT
jgi:hypothetical protein